MKGLDLAWHQVVTGRDLDVLDRLLTDDYRLIVDAARILTKSQEIEAVKTSDPVFNIGSFKLKDMTVRVGGERATISGFLTVKPDGGDKNSCRRYFYTRTFVSRNGRWQILTSRLVTLSGKW